MQLALAAKSTKRRENFTTRATAHGPRPTAHAVPGAENDDLVPGPGPKPSASRQVIIYVIESIICI